MSKIVFFDAYTLNGGDISWDKLYECGEISILDRFDPTHYNSNNFNDTEIIIVNKVKVNQDLIALLPQLKYVVVSATGYNNVDLALCNERGIKVSNVKGYSTEGVVQHVFAALLSHFNRLEYYANQVKDGRWHKTRDFCFYDHSILEMSGKTIGVIGYGTIGKRVAQVAEAFGLNVLIYNKYGQGRKLSEKSQEVDLPTLFRESDIISLHVPLNDQTKEIINSQNLALTKTNVTIVNTGRGGLINEDDLVSFLSNNTHAAALLDVITVEPPQDHHPLYSIDNCHITPHIAWASKESRIRLLDGVIENILAFQKGEPINLVS
jgi:glycerate dehydrogenase